MTTMSSSLTRAGRATTILVGLVLVGVVLTACGGSSNSASTTTKSPGGGATTTTTKASGSGSANPSQLGDLSAAIRAAQKTTFKAVYTLKSPGGTQTVTIEQSPPKSVFATNSITEIDTGSTIYFCSTSNGTTNCSTGGIGSPLGGLTGLFNPETVASELRAAQSEAGAKIAGYHLTFSDKTFAGQSAKCANVTSAAKTAKYCVTDQGILAYAGTAGSNYTLTSFSSSPPASDFALPAGATVVTTPSGAGIPD